MKKHVTLICLQRTDITSPFSCLQTPSPAPLTTLYSSPYTSQAPWLWGDGSEMCSVSSLGCLMNKPLLCCKFQHLNIRLAAQWPRKLVSSHQHFLHHMFKKKKRKHGVQKNVSTDVKIQFLPGFLCALSTILNFVVHS